ncbi:MAG: O-antigen ligase family protein [Gammaproteobacteria bacterium]|nr:O-antigen ligase family protein [Gammaproteobacteria bacterium]MDE0270156.1 O-antigen ligase family protein [Gammaproteobacteria bacterium]
MTSAFNAAVSFVCDRIRLNALLIVLCFAGVLVLESQSAASYPAYLLAILMLVRLRQWTDVFAVPLMWAVAALLAYLVLTSLWSEGSQPGDALSMLSRAAQVLLFAVAFAECQMRGELQRWLGRTLAVTGVLAALAGLGLVLLAHSENGRLVGLGQLDNNVVAALIFGVVLILITGDVLRGPDVLWRRFGALGIVVIAAAVLLSDSRNGQISAMLGVGTLFIAHRVPDRQRFAVAVLGMGVILLAVLAALIANEAGRTFVLPRGDSFRPAIWLATLGAVVDGGLWFGRGILTDDTLVTAAGEFPHPHNMYLSVLSQGGLVGAALFAALIAAVVRTLLNHYGHRDAKLALGILGLALPAWLLDGHELIDKVGMTWFLFWLPVAISLGLAWMGRLDAKRLLEGSP